MLVEFSPWETTDTSLRLSVPKRKRPRGGLSSSSSVCDDDFPIAGSLVTTKTGRRKQRNNPDSSRAVVAITSPYRVSVLVSKGSATATGAPKTEALDAADIYSLHESARLQYTCRPGKTASFLSQAKIPVVFDSKNDRFWALQNGNQQLVVWDAQSEGPDPKGKGIQALEETSLSLDILPNGWVVGSTASGSIYYASVDKDNSTIQVCHLPLPDLKEPLSMDHHAGTFLSMKEVAPTEVLSGSKRKSSKGSEYGTIELYQIFVSGCTATLLLHDLVPTGDHQKLSMERRKHRVAHISLVPPGTSNSDPTVQEATLVPTTIGHPDSVLLYYRLQAEEQYCCTIQLQSAKLAHPPFPVHCAPPRLALITPKMLAMGVHNKVLLCDAHNGVVLHQEDLPFASDDDAEDFVLLSDPRKGLLVALFRTGEHLHATSTTLQVEDDDVNTAAPFQTSLAARLAASLSVPASQVDKPSKLPKRISLSVQKKVEAFKEVDMQFGKALQLVQESESIIFEKHGEGYEKGRLVDAFQRAVAIVNQAPIVLRDCSTMELFPSFSEPEKGGKKKSKSKKAKNKKQQGKTKPTKAPRKDAEERINGNHPASKTSPKKVTKELEEDSSKVTPSDTSEPMNGIHREVVKKKENGASNPPSNRDSIDAMDTDASSEATDSSLPLPFVDVVTPLIVRILLHVGSSANFSVERATLIKEDCRHVLGSLLASGSVYARKHFGDGEDNGLGEGHGLMSLLKCMGCKQTQDSRLRSPIDFMHDVLEHCAEVSESQMVAMIHFMLCRSSPDDIAFAFLDSTSSPANHPHKALSTRYVKYIEQIGSKKAGKSLNDKLERTKSKLVLAGSAALLEKILRYSHCNQALLSSALRETFSLQEAMLLCRLVSDLAFARRLSEEMPGGGSGDIVASAAQWIPALLDAFGDQITGNGDDDNRHSLALLHDSLTLARRHTELLVGLEDSIDESTKLISDQGSSPQKKRRIHVDEDALPGYTVERLCL